MGWKEARLSTTRAADLLRLAATPGFAAMALLVAVPGQDMPAMTCSTAHGVSWLGGMAPMYLLMSAVHAAPWLRLFAGHAAGQGRE